MRLECTSVAKPEGRLLPYLTHFVSLTWSASSPYAFTLGGLCISYQQNPQLPRAHEAKGRPYAFATLSPAARDFALAYTARRAILSPVSLSLAISKRSSKTMSSNAMTTSTTMITKTTGASGKGRN